MTKGAPDRHYQRLTKPSCQCRDESHEHRVPCGSRRYLVVHHLDHERQDQSPENLTTLCSSCHRKEHAEQHHYFGRAEHHTWAAEARSEMQRALLKRRSNGNNEAQP